MAEVRGNNAHGTQAPAQGHELSMSCCQMSAMQPTAWLPAGRWHTMNKYWNQVAWRLPNLTCLAASCWLMMAAVACFCPPSAVAADGLPWSCRLAMLLPLCGAACALRLPLLILREQEHGKV